MGHYEILEKLNSFLRKHSPPKEECDVVYLLVEIRKILDHENSEKYPILRFYSDWAVHTRKDKKTKEIKKVMESIYKEIVLREQNASYIIMNPAIISFADFKELRIEIGSFLNDHGLPEGLVLEDWKTFKRFLAKILTDQPIYNPCDGIRKYSLTPSSDGCVLGEIEYECNPPEYKIFKFVGEY